MRISDTRISPSRILDRLSFEVGHAWESTVAAVRGNGMPAYWYRDVLNFGDLITPLLLHHYGFTPVYERPNRARLVSTGSILEHLPDNYAGTILGSGFIDGASKSTFPNAQILAVRGKLTRQRLGGGRETIALGDPGLLASEVMPHRENKRYSLGIVPHYSEKNDPLLARLMVRLGNNATLINAQDQPLAVFSAIDRCEHILSSSLHGLIVADSLGIPSRWLAPANGLLGGRFKFDDYYSAIGFSGDPVSLTGQETLSKLLAMMQPKPTAHIQSAKEGLHHLWSNLSGNR